MKTKILQTALFILILFTASCTDKRNVKAVTYISPDGVKSVLKLDDGDGKITSGFTGRNTHQEVRNLSLEVSNKSYIITADGATYHIPKTYVLEVID